MVAILLLTTLDMAQHALVGVGRRVTLYTAEGKSERAACRGLKLGLSMACAVDERRAVVGLCPWCPDVEASDHFVLL